MNIRRFQFNFGFHLSKFSKKLTTFKSLCLIFRQKITKTNVDVLNVPIYDCTHQFVKQLLSIHFAPYKIIYLWVYSPTQMQCKQASKIYQTKMVKLGLEDRTNYSIFSKELQFEDTTTYKIIKRNVESPGWSLSQHAWHHITYHHHF